MTALFSRRADRRLRVALAIAAAGIVGVPAFLMGWVRTPLARGEYVPVDQPVAFDHRVHVRGLRIDCRYCHATVERAASAGVPATEVCVPCHSRVWLDAAAFAPVRASLASGRAIPWARVNQLPGFVYFDHAIHVRKGVGCETCHGRVDTIARVAQTVPLTMGWCLDCHRHPERYLRPLAAMTAMGWTPPEPQRELGRALMARYHVRRLTNCTTCHR